MSIDEILAEFGFIADSNGGVARLRALVLSLAVRGLLTSRDPTDPPVSELMEQVRRSVKMQGRRSGKSCTPIEAERIPDWAPGGWTWVRLGDLTSKLGAGSTPLGGKKAYVESGVPFLRSQNVWNSGIRLDGVAFIDSATHARMANTRVCPGDVLLNITGASIGRCAVVPEEFDEGNVSQHVAIVRPVLPDLRHYLHVFLTSPLGQGRIMDVQVGISREGLSMRSLREFPVPVPPLQDQHRIVAKVDELMVLCDELDEKQQHRHTVRRRFQTSALDALANAASTGELTEAWLRVRDNWDAVTEQSDCVPVLRHAIRQLGLQGRLHRTATVEPHKAEEFQVKDLLREPLANGRSVRDGQGPRVLRLSALTDGEINFENHKRGDWSEGDAQRFFVEGGDFLVARGNGSIKLVGRGCIAGAPPFKAAYPDTMIRLRLDPCRVTPSYLQHIWRSAGVRSQIERRARTTSGIYKISQGDIEQIVFNLPPLEDQAAIVARLEELFLLCDDLENRLTEQEGIASRLAESVVHALTT